MNDKTTWSIFITIISILLMIVLIISLPQTKREITSYVSIVGTISSIAGLIFAYMQILSLKQTSVEIEKAVSQSSKRLNTLLSVSDLGKSKKIIEEIQLMLQNDKISAALVRLKDLKELLIQAKNNDNLILNNQEVDYRSMIKETGINIQTLHDHVFNVKKDFNKIHIISDLEETKTNIIEIESYIKNKSYAYSKN